MHQNQNKEPDILSRLPMFVAPYEEIKCTLEVLQNFIVNYVIENLQYNFSKKKFYAKKNIDSSLFKLM